LSNCMRSAGSWSPPEIDMNSSSQSELFSPAAVETAWSPGERRRLRGELGRATIEIEITYSRASFHWSANFTAPTFGTSAPMTAQIFSSAGSAFGAARSHLRGWLERNGEADWRQRLDRWLENKTLADFEKPNGIDTNHNHMPALWR
jgi:hypothetical protein